MAKGTIETISSAFSKLSTVGRLREEVKLLTTCSSDTVYRLRYDTMQYDYISPSVINLLGYSVAELTKINLRSLIIETRIVDDGMKVVESYEELEENRKRGTVQKWQADYLMRTKDGRKIWVSDVSHPWFDKKGAIIGSSGSLRDITERINAEQKIRRDLSKQDYTDELTGLANLRTFWIRLEEEIKRARRTKEDITVMLVNINKVDEIIKTYDQKMAEDVLTGIAGLIRSRLREIDITAHIDKDNFGVIMPETPVENAMFAAKRVMSTITSHKFFANAEGIHQYCAISIGLTGLVPDSNIDANFLYKLADSQLYIAKHKGENQISANNPDDLGQVTDKA